MVSNAESSSKHLGIETWPSLGCLRIVLGPSLAQYGFKQVKAMKFKALRGNLSSDLKHLVLKVGWVHNI